MELGELIAKSFLNCSERDKRGTVELHFTDLKDAKECHRLLVVICEQWWEKHIHDLRPKEGA